MMNYWDGTNLSEAAKPALRAALNVTGCRNIDPEHLLIALLNDAESALVKSLRHVKPDVKAESLVQTLIIAVRATESVMVPAAWSDALLSSRFREMLQTVQATPEWQAADAGHRERLLASAALLASPSRIRVIFDRVGAPAVTLEVQLKNFQMAKLPPLFDAHGDLNVEAFDRRTQKILQLIKTEGKGLGLARIGTPLVLFAFASFEQGLLERALRLQLADPKSVHGNLMLHLRSLNVQRFNEELALHRDLMQDAVVRSLEEAARYASERGLTLIGEAEFLRAFMDQQDHFVTSFLKSVKVDLDELNRFLQQRHSAEIELAETSEKKKLPTPAEIETQLLERIVGQDHVIDIVMPIVKRSRFGYFRPGRPAGVLLFLGHSGTGKTQLAKEIARAVYGSEDQLIYLEMGQYGSEHSKTMFVGAPPGLVGYGEGQLTNGLRAKPECVVLFDEVEKAHKSVFDVVLRFLDEGQIADPAGPVRDGRKCIIILTSNKAIDALGKLIDEQMSRGRMTREQRDAQRPLIREEIAKTEFFRPEFVNRVDDIILFNTFTADVLRTLIRNRLERERQLFQAMKDLDFTFDDAVVELLVQGSLQRKVEGARACERLVSDLVVTLLIDFFSDEQHAQVRKVHLSVSSSQQIAVLTGGGKA